MDRPTHTPKKAKDNTSRKDAGEDQAESYMRKRGFEIVARNWRIKLGEIDIVARKGPMLVFVEVKARSEGSLTHPSESVTYSKQKRLRLLASAYLSIERPDFEECRFDVISVFLGRRSRLEHLEAAF